MRITAIVLLAAITPFATSQTFSPPHGYTLPERPAQIVPADVNHDGRADIVALQPTSKTVAIRLRTPTGSFAMEKSFYAGASPVAIAVSDFNGDRKLDIAVANGSSGVPTVSVLRGNGDGTFSSPTTYAVDGTPNSIAVGDFNNDGRPDIATLSDDNSKLTILRNTGTSFSRTSIVVPTFYTAEFPGGGNKDLVFSLTAGDFNADGRMDLAYADSCTSPDDCGPAVLDTHFVLLNTTSGWSGAAVSGGTGTMTLRAFDVDNDGRADLVDVYNGCHTPCRGVTVAYSNPGGTFSTVMASSDDGSVPLDVTVADINNDGIYDLIVAVTDEFLGIPNGFAVYTGKGGRTGFNLGKFFATNSADFPRTIAAAFFSNDGRQDVIVPDGSAAAVKLRLNSSTTTGDPCAYPMSAGIRFCLPKTGTAAGKTVRFLASAHPQSQPINRLELWVDGHKKFQTFNDRLDRKITLTSGSHKGTIVRVDATGVVAKSSVTFSVP